MSKRQQTMGAMVAGSVLGLALLGALILGTAADETVAGVSARRAGVAGVDTPTGSSPPTAEEADASRPTTGDPELDRVLQQAEREGRLTPEQVAAITRAISGQPSFEDVRRLSEADIQRLSDATGLSPEELAPILAELVATGRIVMPVRPPQAVASAPSNGQTGPPWT